MDSADFVVIGGGIIGLSIALRTRQVFSDASIILVEKEPHLGFHASTRNSGVLHAGFYYTPDSLKAKLTRIGAERMRDYCSQNNLPLNACGKLVVARHSDDLAGLQLLLERGRANGVNVQELTTREALEIEPRVKTFHKALFSPNTATVDPAAVVNSLAADASRAGVDIRCGVRYVRRRDNTLTTSSGEISTGYVINAAGLYADKVAHDFGFGEGMKIVGFKGLYLYSDEPPYSLRTNIYPVPDLKNPFLGVHFTITADGHVKIGPTAIPCLWREQYGWRERFQSQEMADSIKTLGGLMVWGGFDFRALALEEVRKYRKRYLVSQAARLVEGVQPSQFKHWGKPGIRAQLMSTIDRKLGIDFCIQGDEKSFHILNAVSPAFTCAFAFAEYTCDEICAKLGGH